MIEKARIIFMKIEEFNNNDYEVIEFHNEINHRLQIEPMYFKLNFSPVPKIFGRVAVLNRILKALEYIPQEYGLNIWDVYRPRSVQEKLFNWMKEEVRKNFPAFSEEENYAEVKKYMSPPSAVGDDYCPPHLSGGAIDLTLYEIASGEPLDLGTAFDDCTERAHRDYFNPKTSLSASEKIIKERRQMLQTAMTKVGFSSYEYEWWHFDLGNIFWSRITKNPAVFGPLFGNEEWPETVGSK
jgi:D-alanyl-D-alanine dipeptidase